MIGKGRGKIINFASMLSFFGGYTVPAYAASKGGIAQITKTFSNEWASKGLCVNAIAPGFFVGNQNRALLLNEDGSYTDRGETIIRNTPMKRFGEAEELNGAIHFLCSDAAKFITGVVLPIDGGFSAFSGV
jgi:NAD(P)-dependent dehydrogenase (short-subunit alcohol dehydrogenase family)